MRVRDDDHRQAERAGLGERRGPGAADEHVARHERVRHLAAQERIGLIAVTPACRQLLARLERIGVGRLAGHVDHLRVLDQIEKRVPDGPVDPPNLLRAAENEHDGRLRFEVKSLACARAVVPGKRPDGRACHVATARQRLCRLREADRQHVRESGRGAHASAGDDVAFPHDARNAQRGSGHDDWDRHVAARREHGIGSPAQQPGFRDRQRRGQSGRVQNRVVVQSRLSAASGAATGRSGKPSAGTMLDSSPRCPPSHWNSTSGTRSRRDLATANAG